MSANSTTYFKEKSQRAYVKHAVLDSYLKAWFPINIYAKKSPVYIDGFAGPGKYENGDDGSPLLVLKMLKDHNIKSAGTVHLFFIEKDEKMFQDLKRNLDLANATIQSKNKIIINIYYIHGDFNDEMMRILVIAVNNPILVFADPFGFNCKMSTLKSILQTHSQRASRELLINFMDGNVIRFLGDPTKKNAINELMGSSNWQTENFEQNSEGKRNMLCQQYIDTLEEGYNSSTDNQVEIKSLRFAVKGKNNAHVYDIVYATSHVKGIMEMKRAMSKSSQVYNDFTFSEWLEDKKEFRDFALEKELKTDEIVTMVVNGFAGQSDITGRDILELIDSTNYHCNVKNELKKELRAFITTPPSIKRFSKMKFKFPTVADSNGNNGMGNADLSESTNSGEWKARIIKIEKYFAGKTVSGGDISAFFKSKISDKLNHEKILQKKFESKQVDKNGRKGFANTMYFFPKIARKILASPKGQPMITDYYKCNKVDSVKKNFNNDFDNQLNISN